MLIVLCMCLGYCAIFNYCLSEPKGKRGKLILDIALVIPNVVFNIRNLLSMPTVVQIMISTSSAPNGELLIAVLAWMAIIPILSSIMIAVGMVQRYSKGYLRFLKHVKLRQLVLAASAITELIVVFGVLVRLYDASPRQEVLGHKHPWFDMFESLMTIWLATKYARLAAKKVIEPKDDVPAA